MNETTLELRPVASSAAYADKNAMVMVLLVDEEAVKVMVETVVYDEDGTAIPGDERVSQEATAAETVFFVEEVTVVETSVEVTVVETVVEEVTVVTVVEEVTAVSCVCWCSSVRRCYAGKSDHAQQKHETRDDTQQPFPGKCG